MANDLRERLAERIWRNWPGVKANDMLIAEPEMVQDRVYEMADLAIAVFREWLESEAVTTPLYVAPEGTPHHEAYVEGWRSCLVRLKALAANLEPEGTEDE